jgi:drug/metabolite transporter (DMT)-like permease
VMLSEVIFASASAVLFGAETISPMAWLGGLLIIGSAGLGALVKVPEH